MRSGLQFEKFLVFVVQGMCAIAATSCIEIQKCRRFRLCVCRAHFVDDSAVNHFSAYAGGIAGDLGMELHGRRCCWCEKKPRRGTGPTQILVRRHSRIQRRIRPHYPNKQNRLWRLLAA
jgi:hypothetical protein